MIIALPIVKFKRTDFNSHSEFRKSIATHLKSILYTKTVVNIDTQILIRFNKAGIEKIVSQIGDIKAIEVCNLQLILTFATFIETKVDRKNRQAILAVHLYKCEVEIEDATHEVWIYIREMTNGYFLYSLNIKA